MWVWLQSVKLRSVVGTLTRIDWFSDTSRPTEEAASTAHGITRLLTRIKCHWLEWRILCDKTHGFSVANLSRLHMTDFAVWMVLMMLICDPKCRFSSKISKDRFPTAASLWYYLVWFAEWPDRHWTIHPHSEHRFPAPSSTRNSVRFSYATEGALFISARSCPSTRSAPSGRFGY